MKRRQNSSIFPLRFVLFMTAVFAAVILLPIAAGASMGTLDLPVGHTLEGETLYLTPEAGWSIQSVQLSEDSVLTAETGTDRAAVVAPGPPRGRSGGASGGLPGAGRRGESRIPGPLKGGGRSCDPALPSGGSGDLQRQLSL